MGLPGEGGGLSEPKIRLLDGCDLQILSSRLKLNLHHARYEPEHAGISVAHIADDFTGHVPPHITSREQRLPERLRLL